MNYEKLKAYQYTDGDGKKQRVEYLHADGLPQFNSGFHIVRKLVDGQLLRVHEHSLKELKQDGQNPS